MFRIGNNKYILFLQKSYLKNIMQCKFFIMRCYCTLSFDELFFFWFDILLNYKQKMISLPDDILWSDESQVFGPKTSFM